MGGFLFGFSPKGFIGRVSCRNSILPGNALGYNDQKIIEARELICAIAEGRPAEPDFRFGHEITRVIDPRPGETLRYDIAIDGRRICEAAGFSRGDRSDTGDMARIDA